MASEVCEALILRHVDFKESDRIIGLLTASRGRISAFARSARKSSRRFGGSLDLFSLVRAELSPPRSTESGLWALHHTEVIELHLGLRSHLDRISLASYLAECVIGFTAEGEPHVELFNWLSRSFAGLSEEAEPSGRMPTMTMELLALCGFAPHVDRCLDCGREPSEGNHFFSFGRGGLLCRGCRPSGEGRWISSAVAAALRAGRISDVDLLSTQRELLTAFAAHLLGRVPRSEAFLLREVRRD